jgi:hypothetical protein
MSKSIKPKQGIVYECYKGFTDTAGDRCRVGQKFTWNGELKPSGIYTFEKVSGRGIEIYVREENFTSHFIPASEQTETETEFKIGDVVRIDKNSDWYDQGSANPINIDGVITNFMDEDLGILVKWANDETNSYNKRDLVLAKTKQKSYSDMAEAAVEAINTMGLKAFDLNTIVVTSMEQIKELAKVPFLKDQIEAQFPELFITHKVGNRYRHEDENYYILASKNNRVSLVNLITGQVESHTITVEDTDSITVSEFKGLCLDTDKLQLIKERQ